MRRNYMDSMQANGLNEFLLASNALRNCKYIVAESKITLLLKSIADNKQLYSMFAACLYGFDYNQTFAECINEVGSFVLPDDKKKAIAVVFRLLLDIDSGKIELRNFLEAYFYSDMINESYARFCLEVLTPFESYCQKMFSEPIPMQEIPLTPVEKESEGNFRSDVKADALNCITTLIAMAEAAIDGVIDREEFCACINGLKRALSNEDYESVISSFLGVKYAVAYFFKSSKTVLDIYKKLEYDVKHLVGA